MNETKNTYCDICDEEKYSDEVTFQENPDVNICDDCRDKTWAKFF